MRPCGERFNDRLRSLINSDYLDRVILSYGLLLRLMFHRAILSFCNKVNNLLSLCCIVVRIIKCKYKVNMKVYNVKSSHNWDNPLIYISVISISDSSCE